MAIYPRHGRAALFMVVVCGLVAAISSVAAQKPAAQSAPAASAIPDTRALLDTYCVTCHNQRSKTAGLALDIVDAAAPHTSPEIFERVIARLRAESMPPAGRPPPDSAT